RRHTRWPRDWSSDVCSSDLFYPKQTSLWTLISPDSQFSKEPYDSVVGIFGRLKPGVSMADAEQELVGLHQRVIRQSPAGNWVGQIGRASWRERVGRREGSDA